ncbi:hypothetical protein CVT24_007689 [Panaeolus cyanescens]|uniref:Elongator complex protein 5 n=1 Tax=Panaeolus cyanescens TaxID=181874 RepID=A0A409VRH1_9AGAR|nr:hypothetical protein CVT24_007689 [Panaeolus cyanescens]
MILPPFNLPEGIILLITDELGAPGKFLLHRALAQQLKADKTAIILSVSESLARWKALATKSNLNLEQRLNKGSLTFIDALNHIQPNFESPNQALGLDIIFEQIRSRLDQSTDESPLVILDDLASLEWMGFPTISLTRFLRALRALCLKKNATLIILQHILNPEDPQELLRNMLQISTYHLEVRPLSSGRSGTVSGEVALHLGFSAPPNPVKLIPRSAALQYRLTDTGPEFFAKGTSEVVL